MEHTLLTVRQHRAVLIPRIMTALFWSTIAAAIAYVMLDESLTASVSAFILVFLGFLVVIVYRRRGSRLAITNRRLHLIVKTGLLSEIDATIAWEKIQDITFSQETAFHKIFNCGTLYIRSGSGDGVGLPIRHIPRDKQMLDSIQDIWHLHSGTRLALTNLEEVEKAIYASAHAAH